MNTNSNVHPVVTQQPLSPYQQPPIYIGVDMGSPNQVWRKWSSGLCGCFEDCAGCMYCAFCFPCFACTLASNMDEFCCGPFCCGITFLAAMRSKLRGERRIRGSICDDVVCMTCCTQCTAHQMYRELKNSR